MLADIITSTAAQGVTVVIPAFAVGRAQRILFHLHRLKENRRIPDLPIYLDSPMAQNASDLLCRHREYHRLGRDRCGLICKNARYVRDVEESKALDYNKFPKVILSASGMATGGRVIHHLKVYLRDPNSVVVFTGFQAAGTRGAHLVAGAKTVKIHGGQVPVRAHVHNLDMLSSHAGQSEILSWLRAAPRPPRGVIITHGEASAADALRLRIEDELGWPCQVPFLGEVIDLDARSKTRRRPSTSARSGKRAQKQN
jgi:metallo-beta-lactamase family protein